MKKEFILAIVIGFVLGLIITLGIWTANKSLKNLPTGTKDSPTPTSAQNAPTPTTSQQPTSNSMPLDITTPENESITDKSTTTVTGKTKPAAVVTIVYETGEKVISADTQGSFSTDITLESGYNQITVTATDANGVTVQKLLLVTYTTAKI